MKTTIGVQLKHLKRQSTRSAKLVAIVSTKRLGGSRALRLARSSRVSLVLDPSRARQRHRPLCPCLVSRELLSWRGHGSAAAVGRRLAGFSSDSRSPFGPPVLKDSARVVAQCLGTDGNSRQPPGWHRLIPDIDALQWENYFYRRLSCTGAGWKTHYP